MKKSNKGYLSIIEGKQKINRDWFKEYDLPKEYSDEMYLEEQLVSKLKTNLQISSLCNARCIFCCNNMGPLPIERRPFRSLDSVRRGIELMDGSYSDTIGLRLFRRLSEGEAILHPQLLTILAMIREKFPDHIIEIETNGSTLKESLIKLLAQFNPMSICISYHSHNPDNWSKVLKLPSKLHKYPREAFRLLQKYNINIEPTLSPLPNFCGWSDIEETIAYISKYERSMDMSGSCFSSDIDEEVQEWMKIDYQELFTFIRKMEKKYNIVINSDPDIGKDLEFYPKWVILDTIYNKYKNVVWLVSECAYDRAKKILNKESRLSSSKQHIEMVKNLSFGGNIIVSGILLTSDFKKAGLKAIENLDEKPDLFIIPSVCFDNRGEDLGGESYKTLEKNLGADIWMIADQKDYDANPYDTDKSSIENLKRKMRQTYEPYNEN